MRRKLGLIVACCLALIPLVTAAGDVQITAGQPVTVSLTSPSVSYTLTTTTGINTLSVSGNTMTLTLDAGDSVIVQQANGYDIQNDISAQTTCSGTTSSITFTATAVITSSTTKVCTSSGGGGGSPPSDTSIIINGGAAETTTRSVTLTLSAGNATEMKISNLSDFSDRSFEAYATSKSWTLTAGNEVKRVYVIYRSSAGDESPSISDTITLAVSESTPAPSGTTPSAPGGGGGGGGGSSVGQPSVYVPAPIVPPAVTTTDQSAVAGQTSSTDPKTGAVVYFFDPSNPTTLLAGLGAANDDATEQKYRPLILADGKEFGVTLSALMTDDATTYVSYGIDGSTKALGAGERRAALRDYLETTGFSAIKWGDVARMAAGMKPVDRNLSKEQAQVTQALKTFESIYGHRPNFQNAEEDLAWNTLMYRIRFQRDLDKERAGIVKFKKIFGRNPVTPFQWSTVRVLGYVKK
ncbi:MAG: hypothetical protein HY422_02715 [Candidatus Komeilibacteria bacterium]|nr:hypothetical protein [Candidatus Komeilibacteria bacterium]